MDNGYNHWKTMESADLVGDGGQHHAEVDGVTLNDWLANNEIGRSTGYGFLALVKELGVEPEKTKGSGSKPLVLLSGPVLEFMNQLLADHRRGMSLPELKRKYTSNSSAIAPAAPMALIQNDEPANDPENLLMRLEAASLAQSTGLPLTKSEVQWILGAGVATEAATMARCRIEKRGRRWTLLSPPG
jgi:hypothetical protein